jgi:UDP-3-O-[3-hydroxymyristoyl] glucosamine N-acyltransferase
MKLRLSDIASLLNGTIEGDELIEIDSISSLENGKAGSISFLSNPKYENQLYQTQASAVIVDKDYEIKSSVNASVIRVENAYSGFTLLLEAYQRQKASKKIGIEKPVFIGEQTTHGEECYIGAFTHLGDGVKIGKNVKIYPNCTIGDNVSIGDHTIIYPGVSIYSETEVGNYCILHSGVVLGSDGFGFAPKEDGSYHKIPQVGKVILEDHVEIGANTTVDCGTFDATIIKSGVKLDNLIQVAHNVEIDEHTVVAAQAGISGSSKVGKNCVIGGQAGLVGHIKIADGSKIQAQSGLTKGTRPGQAVYGSPALDYSQYVKSYSVFRRLPDVLKRIEALEEKMIN